MASGTHAGIILCCRLRRLGPHRSALVLRLRGRRRNGSLLGRTSFGGSPGEVGVVDGAHGFQVGIQLPAVGVLLPGLVLSVQGGQAIQEQLGDVGEGDGVAALDAFGGKLLKEIPQEEIDGISGGEVLDGAEQLCGDDFGIGRGSLRPAQAKMPGGSD